jgi:hypothetical protein
MMNCWVIFLLTFASANNWRKTSINKTLNNLLFNKEFLIFKTIIVLLFSYFFD